LPSPSDPSHRATPPSSPWQRCKARLQTRFLLSLAERLHASDGQIALLWAVPAGIAGALATLGFRETMDWLERLIFGRDGDMATLAALVPWQMRVVVPVIGGILAGLLLMLAQRYTDKSRHSDYMEAITLGDGVLPVRQTLIRSAASLSSIVSGASIGREGPMVQLAALAASLVGRARRISPERLRTIVACGAAAGLTSAYGAPFASAFFVSEIVLGSVVAERMGPLIVAAVVSNVAMRALPGYTALYTPPPLPTLETVQFLAFPLLGLVMGILSPLFMAALRSGKRAGQRLPLSPRWALPVRLGLGGLLVGTISIWFPQTWGNGYGVVNQLMHVSWPWTTLLLVLIFKVLATVISAGSGAVGGVFTPTLFVGAALGALCAKILAVTMPAIHPDTITCVIVGMGAFLAATAQAPLMAILMVFEMTSSYQIMLPLMLCAIVAFFVSRSLTMDPMYSATSRINAKRAADERARGTRVRELMKTTEQIVDVDATLDAVRRVFLAMPVKYVYLVDADRKLYGFLALSDFNRLMAEGTLDLNAPAKPMATSHVPVLYPDDSAAVALQAFLRHEGERLPVVASPDDRTFLGVISKADFLTRIESLV
jgi:CIC family chloride channel protein